MIKSPLNYLGNKYKLSKEIIPLFPKEINNFYDVFCGGLDISLNVAAKNVIANDVNKDLIWLLEQIKNDKHNLLDKLIQIENDHFPMNTYKGKALRSWYNDKDIYNQLFESKKKSYYRLRDKYNQENIEQKDYTILLSLIINSFGLVEFRSKDGYVTYTCGKGRLNDNIRKTIPIFKSKIDNVKFFNKDFRFIENVEFDKNDFIYLDPPYLNTSQYRDKWTEKDEEGLYVILDSLHRKNIKFALSNFKDGENHTNTYLNKWCKNYRITELGDNHHLLSRFGKDNRIEILVTNY